MVWEQDTRLVLALSSIDSQECRPFWPSMIGETLFWDTNKRGEQLRLTLLEEVDTFAKRSIRLNLELCVSLITYPWVRHPKKNLKIDHISIAI